MIWVVGDIHGMFDPLRQIMAAIRRYEERGERGEKVEKIIFIGDYMDHGPSSREVIDYLLTLEYETVFLAGNHEDMALRLIRNNRRMLDNYGNQWLCNGGVETMESFFDRPADREIFRGVQDCRTYKGWYRGEGFNHESYESMRLPAKYKNFLLNLRYSHSEEIPYRGRAVRFAFTHGLPRWDQPLAEQMHPDYDSFDAYLERESSIYGWGTPAKWQFSEGEERQSVFRERKIPLDDNCLWGRVYNYRDGYEGNIVVHGHTPTCVYEEYYLNRSENVVKKYKGQFEKYSPLGCLPFIFCRDENSGYIGRYERREILDCYFDCADSPIDAINVDTGAVYGYALTAIGISQREMERGRIRVLSAYTSGSQRDPRRLFDGSIKLQGGHKDAEGDRDPFP